MNTVKQLIHRLNQGLVDETEQATSSEIIIYHQPAYLKVQLRLEKRSIEPI